MGPPGSLRKAVHFYTEALEYLIFLLFAALVLIGFLNVMTRNIPGFPIITWGEETTSFLMVAIAFLASGLALRRGLHLGFDLLVERLPEPWRRLLWTVNYGLMIWFLGALVYAGFPLAVSNMQQYAASIPLRMGYPFMAVPIGSLLMIGECLAKLAEIWWPQRWGTDPPSPGHTMEV